MREEEDWCNVRGCGELQKKSNKPTWITSTIPKTKENQGIEKKYKKSDENIA